jgi:hypothetical protein
MFLINKGDQPMTVPVEVPASSALVDRMSSYDPTSSGKTLDAPAVQVDGRQVGADGSWPGFAPQAATVRGDRLDVDLAPGEAAVITVNVER